jgi:3-phytase
MRQTTSAAVAACLLAAGMLSACAQTPKVSALVETPPVGLAGDAADDPAIWVAPTPAQSRVIGTQKKGGYFVYDLDGKTMQEIPLGLPNNVDLVDGFAWSEGAAPLVVASDRADNTLPLFRIDPATGLMDVQPRARIATGWAEVYGVCIGRHGADTLVIATSKIGEVGVWKVAADLSAEKIGAFALGSIAEGCVIDGVRGVAYVAQELEGLWRFALDDASGAQRTLVDKVGDGRLVADVEGVSLWEGAGESGYIVVSVQGRSQYAVYERAGDNAYRGSFRIVGGGADRVSGTDGIAVVSALLGDKYPRGLMVAQDDRNTRPRATQNFKYVSWADVAAALALD